MNSISISRSSVRWLFLFLFSTTLIAQQPPADKPSSSQEKPKQTSPWDKPDPNSPWDSADPNSPWDTINPLSVWDNPNAGASWDTANPFTGPITGRWRGSHRDGTGGTFTSDWQLEENGTSIRMYPVAGPANKENTFVGQRRGNYIVVAYPPSGYYACPKGSRAIPVYGIDEMGLSDDGKTLTHRIREWDLTGESPNCKAVLKESWNDFQTFQRLGSLKELRYVELKNGEYVSIDGELRHGSTFYVEAIFDAKPTEDEYAVQLSWDEGAGSDVKLTPSSDPTVFRSEAIRLQPPQVNQ